MIPRSANAFGLQPARRHPRLPTLCTLGLLALGGCWAASAQTQTPLDCSNSVFGASPACGSVSQQTTDQTTRPIRQGSEADDLADPARAPRAPDNRQVYVDTAGAENKRPRTADARDLYFPPDPQTDLQKLAKQATGDTVPVFGRDLFERAPSTFAPADQIPVTPDYIVGPGDEVLVRLWGAEASSGNSQLTVDPSGNIYIPKVGAIQVAGLRVSDLQTHIAAEVNHVFRNYRISVSLGHLRSIQVYVVGEARRPGAYTVSALSTLLNALFASGGPNVQGSMRHIQIRRAGQTLPDFDLYDLVLRGDKSRDVRLESGDTIFIPSVGPQVALAGSIRHPAIYELKDATTLEDVLTLAGGFSATGEPNRIRLERIDTNFQRRAEVVNLDAEGRAMPLRDGDVLYANHIAAGYGQSVTIRGNLANPGRFAWHPGMRLSDILPDRRSLLTNNYWRERNRLGIPTPLFDPAPDRPNPSSKAGTELNAQGQGNRASTSNRNGLNGGMSTQEALSQVQPPEFDGAETQPELATAGVVAAGVPNAGGDGTSVEGISSGLSSPPSAQGGKLRGQADAGINRIRIPAPEIDWAYAVIERLDPETLKSSLVPFNLGKLVGDRDPEQNLELQPGDVVTILSQRDILVPQDLQTKYVRLEGEFAGAGVYSAGPNETLDQVVRRAGGFTGRAYLYGSSFQRESARVFQQQRLDEYITELSTNMERETAVRGASSPTGISDPNALLLERNLVSQLRSLRATGRIVLEFRPASLGTEAVPAIPLENGDVFRVPSRPNIVSVIGAVYGQNVFLYDAHRHVEDYLALAGKPNRVADKDHAFIIRADGSIFSRERARGVLSNHFDDSQIYPGDAIVVPEKLIKPTGLRQLLDYSQILSSFGLAAAAINVVR